MARRLSLVAVVMVMTAVLAFVVLDVAAESLVVALVTIALISFADRISKWWRS